MTESTIGSVTTAPAAPKQIGEMLVSEGLLGPSDLEAALDMQRHTGVRLGETLVALGFVSAYDIARFVARRLGIEFVDLAETPVDQLLAQSVSEELARRYQALPVVRRDAGVLVAMADPQDVFAIDDLRMLLRATIIPAMADREQVLSAIDRIWPRTSLASSVDDATTEAEEDLTELADPVALSEDAPIVRLVNAILSQAIEDRASDIHLEPGTNRLRVRFRVDGVLHDASEAPLTVHRSVTSRLKIMAGIDITQTRLPQDGRFTVNQHGEAVDIRMATLPTAYGEAAVLRLLDQRTGVMKLDALGFEADQLARYESAFRMPQGAILASGPTGSGKTSTLYATLVEINDPELGIISVEDPVEYRVDGVKQTQIDVRAGLTFPTALRAILRADPDVILVGEIRDPETARIAAEAALTGHLVLSSIHTTRAAAVPLRLIDMGVEPFLVTSALTCVVGQRLVRRLCTRCAVPHQPDRDLRRSLALPDSLFDEEATVMRAVGCPQCAGSGYRGRIALYEVMTLNDDIGRLIVARASSAEIEAAAVASGMETLHTEGLRRVAEGIVSIEEMLRVVI